MQMRIVAANGVAAQKLQAGKPIGNAYRRAVEAFQTTFPKADNLPLLLMDYHFLKQDYPKTAKAVDQLDQQVGGDPYLNLFRANIAIGQNDAEAARGFVETLIKALPDKAPKAMAFCSIRRLRPKTTSKPPAYSRRWRPKPRPFSN